LIGDDPDPLLLELFSPKPGTNPTVLSVLRVGSGILKRREDASSNEDNVVIETVDIGVNGDETIAGLRDFEAEVVVTAASVGIGEGGTKDDAVEAV
jgi:hypothetical protein